MYKYGQVIITASLLLFGLTSMPAAADLIMSAPPREKPDVGKKVYGPVAAYISQIIGEKVIYKHPGAWGIYQGNLQTDKYDIVFDGPHFAAWRVNRKGHEIIANTPGSLAFIVAVRSTNKRFKKLKDLRGRAVCGLAPPNLATLTLYRAVGVGREPRLVSSTSFPDAFNKMLAGKCDGVVMRDKTYKKLSKKFPNKSRVIYKSGALPSQAITAGKKINAASKNLLKEKLVSPEANKAMTAFVNKYTGGKGLQKAESKKYRGLEILLKDIWGFGV